MAIIKLCEAKVINIYRKTLMGISDQKLAKYYNVSDRHIRRVIAGMNDNPTSEARWSWVWIKHKERIENEFRRKNLQKVQ